MSDGCFDKPQKAVRRPKSEQKHPSASEDGSYPYTCDDTPDINSIFNEYCSDCGVEYKPAIFDAVEKIVVYGDIHGDYDIAVEMLEAADLIRYNNAEKDYDWIGGNTYVVQVGDQVDRCRPIPGGPPCKDPKATKNDEDSDVKILKLYNRLDKQARQDGGMVISLLGNHELLNATGYMQYVSHAGLKGFEDYTDPETGKGFEDGMRARIHAFSPGNEYGRLLGCTRYPAVIVGSNIFVHAGIIDGLIDDLQLSDASDIEKINIKLRMWLLGLIDEECISHIIDNRDVNSMFWTRVLGRIDPGVPLDSEVCSSNLSKALKIFHMNDENSKTKMVIGHTPQSFMYSDDINSTCGNRIWRVDNGSSKAFDSFDLQFVNTNKRTLSRRTQYLTILNDNQYLVCDANQCKEEKTF
jgi:Calcineurin-like phosphoesterase